MSAPLTTLNVQVAGRSVPVYLVRLSDGRIVARTEAELEDAGDELRVAAGFPPKGSL